MLVSTGIETHQTGIPYFYASVTAMHRNGTILDFLEKDWAMADICVRRQFIPHFNQLDMLPFPGKMNGDFASRKPASQYENVLGYPACRLMVIIHENDIITVNAGNIWYDRL